MGFRFRRRPTSRSLLHAMTQWCRGPLECGVRATDADRYVKRYRSRALAHALICHRILGIDSLRQLKRRLDHDPLLRRHVRLGGISDAQLPRLLERRPSALWVPLLKALITQLQGCKTPSELRVMDTSFFTMSARIFSRIHGRTLKRGVTGMKLGLVIDPANNAPVRWHVRTGQGSDVEQLDALIPPEDDIRGLVYVFDRGFLKLDFYRQLIERGAHFVTPADGRVLAIIIGVDHLDPAHPEVIGDETVLLGKPRRRGRLSQPIRRITVETDDGPLVLWSSDLHRPAHEIAQIYRRRWAIEIDFRWLKSTIGCQRPLGFSQNAAEHTFYAALVAFLLALLVAHADAQRTTEQTTIRIKQALTTINAYFHQRPPRKLLQALGFE